MKPQERHLVLNSNTTLHNAPTCNILKLFTEYDQNHYNLEMFKMISN